MSAQQDADAVHHDLKRMADDLQHIKRFAEKKVNDGELHRKIGAADAAVKEAVQHIEKKKQG